MRSSSRDGDGDGDGKVRVVGARSTDLGSDTRVKPRGLR